MVLVKSIKSFFLHFLLAAIFSVCGEVDSTEIVYLFCGHSNAKFFFDYGGADEFLNTMEAMYCGYHFSTIRCDYLANRLVWMKKGDDRYDRFLRKVDSKKDSAVIAGLFLWFGYGDAWFKNESDGFTKNTNRIINDVIIACENVRLPVLVNRYDINAYDNDKAKFHKAVYRDINELCDRPDIACFPVHDMPQCRYKANDHHYDTIGHKVLGLELFSIIQLNRLDFWHAK